ncbi:unnamed protein product, partial [Phaeothamnion confervicola]
CFDRFVAREHLGADMPCERCAGRRPKTKRMSFASLPTVLTLHLKRFDAVTDRKIEDFVRFPARDLDLGRYLSSFADETTSAEAASAIAGASSVAAAPAGTPLPTQSQPQPPLAAPLSSPPHLPYNLMAVVNHSGTLSQGHYTAYVKESGRWFRMDDAWVQAVEEEEVLGSEAYILFYIRRGAAAHW